MDQLINIPALNGAISLGIGVTIMDGKEERVDDFGNVDHPYDESFKFPDSNKVSEIKIQSLLRFPPLDEKGKKVQSNEYYQYVTAIFPLEIQNGAALFTVTDKSLQGEPYDSRAQQKSPFRFIEGKAWLSATQNPKYLALKIVMVLGSPDVIVNSWDKQSSDASWKVGVDIGGGDDSKKASAASMGGKIIDKIEKYIPKVTFEREGGGGSSNQGGSRTIGQLSQTREWTMILELPKPKQPPKPPQPVIYHEGYMHMIYFDTNKKEIGNYLNPVTKTDQIKDLQRFIDEKIARYGKDNITGIVVNGFASRLGDTLKNINLSENRARNVADLLKRLYKFKIPDDNITFHGESFEQQGNDKDNSWKERVVWVTINADRRN